MSARWVAGGVRARAMTRRRLGRESVRALASAPSLDAALAVLVGTPYGHDVTRQHQLGEAQRAVTSSVLWNCRVLSGWVPREGAAILRVLVGGLEIANVADLQLRWSGQHVPRPYALGGLATAWSRLARTTGPDDLRRALAASPWGDPGGTDPRTVGLALRTSLADRTIAAVPQARDWAAGATALLLARELAGGQVLPPRAAIGAAHVLGPRAPGASGLGELTESLPRSGRWALTGASSAADLWQAEARWWRRVESDAFGLVRGATEGPGVLVGAVALMATDAWRVRGALEIAARGGRTTEVLDAVA